MTAGTPTIPKVNPLTVIWGEVLVAMDRQDMAHGEPSRHAPNVWLGHLMQALTHVAVDVTFAAPVGSYRAHLLELAATAIAAVECWDQQLGRAK